MKFLQLTWIFSCFLAFQGHAHQVKGLVQNTEGQILSDVYVQVLNTELETNANHQGSFSFQNLNGNYSLKFSMLGYSDLIENIEINSDTSIIFHLTPSTYTLNEVVVSATKREEPILRIPTAITYLSSQKIKENRVWNLEDLVGMVPNMQYAQLGTSYQQQVALRGISVFSETPSVATYIDGVISLDISGNGLQLMDIESMEILRGPQGTLYGRNAMGGVINITTKQPNNKRTAFIESSIGNQGLQRHGFGFKTPLNKKLFLGISGQFQRTHGFYTNDLSNKTTFVHEPLKGIPEDGVRMGDENSYYGNLFLKWLANEQLDITFNVKYQYDHSTGASAYYQAVENDSIAVNDPYKFAVNSLGSHQRSVLNSHVALKYFHKKFQVVSSISYQNIQQGYQNIDQDLWAYDLTAGYTFNNKVGDRYPQNILSHETRFSSKKSAKRFKWIAGVFSFYQKNDKKYAAVNEQLALFFGMRPGTEVTFTKQNNSGAAIFGETYLDLSKWKFTVGLRGDIENRRTNLSRFYLLENEVREYNIPDTLMNSVYYALSPKVAVQYHISKDQQVYASYSRGFRAGGNNLFTRGKYSEYLPENSNNYELGYKFLSSNKKYQLSAVLFYLQWNNMQLDMQPEPGYWIIDNIGTAKSLGAEIEFSAKPFKGLNIDANLGLNQAKYGEFLFLGENIKGYQTIIAPKSTLQVAPQYTLGLKKIALKFRAEWRRIGEQYFDLNNTIHQPPYHLINMRTGLQYKNLNVDFWVQNLSETEYIAYAMPGYFKNTILNRPRMFGTTINFKI